MNAEFVAAVHDIVRQIPPGRVATYGQVALLAGWPRHARHVGRLMAQAVPQLQLPCQRVVNAAGRPAPQWPEQRALLEQEGVPFRRNGCADLDRCQWRPASAQDAELPQ